MDVFQVLQRDEQSTESCNLQTLTEFMESSSKWFSLHVIFQTNCCIWLIAEVQGWFFFLHPGIITVILCFHNISKHCFICCMGQWMQETEEDFHVINTHYSSHTCISLPFISQKPQGPLCGVNPQTEKCLLITGIPTSVRGTLQFQFKSHPVWIVFIWQWQATNCLPGITV